MDNAKPTAPGLRLSHDPMYQLLREGCIKEFNVKKAAGDKCDLRSCDLRGLDLRGLDAAGLDFSNSYFRQSDLRGSILAKRPCKGRRSMPARSPGFFSQQNYPPRKSNSPCSKARVCATRSSIRCEPSGRSR